MRHKEKLIAANVARQESYQGLLDKEGPERAAQIASKEDPVGPPKKLEITATNFRDRNPPTFMEEGVSSAGYSGGPTTYADWANSLDRAHGWEEYPDQMLQRPPGQHGDTGRKQFITKNILGRYMTDLQGRQAQEWPEDLSPDASFTDKRNYAVGSAFGGGGAAPYTRRNVGGVRIAYPVQGDYVDEAWREKLNLNDRPAGIR